MILAIHNSVVLIIVLIKICPQSNNSNQLFIKKYSNSRLFNAKEISSKDGFTTERDQKNDTYVLSIAKLNPALHTGILTIKARNELGSAHRQLFLNVHGIYIEDFRFNLFT